MSPRPIALLVLLATPAVAVLGCAEDAAVEQAATTVRVENLRLVREADGSRTVRGVVVNEDAQERSVQVSIALYDAANQRIDEVQVAVERVAPGAQQGFSRTLDGDAAGASVRSILVF